MICGSSQGRGLRGKVPRMAYLWALVRIPESLILSRGGVSPSRDSPTRCRVFVPPQRVSELEGELAATKETARAASLGHKATESKLRLQVRAWRCFRCAMASRLFLGVGYRGFQWHLGGGEIPVPNVERHLSRVDQGPKTAVFELVCLP